MSLSSQKFQWLFNIEPGILKELVWCFHKWKRLILNDRNMLINLCKKRKSVLSIYNETTVHGILHTRILEWVAIPFSRGSYQSRDQTQISSSAHRFFTSRATREAQEGGSG